MMATKPRKMTIDIFSDVMCPWCIIGYGQLQKGLAELEGEIEAEIRWCPFELNPDMPAEGEERSEHIARKYRRTAEETRGVQNQMRQVAEQAGVSLDYTGGGEAPPAMMWNTFDAHKLLAWALAAVGPTEQTALKLALFEAHFNQRRNIGQRDVLLDVVDQVGLDRKAAEAVLDDPQMAQHVRAEQAQAHDLNITGVPAMIVEGKILIPGAQAPEVYANALRRVAEKFPA
ncbi:DsbA family oxidoreductase [Pontixanthobacter aestiaquae]|uniref:Thioredoxin domain-containing protein n=1 Tax=Pontixanthobacter aestiaquae TaxID=1509367 RepID=A0A844ZA19_9SPHN|nr:DsbA family oxidoreductase [Pontixanthobacter aestiaquae]MDN3644953.1 DsbA family oxidoreductase [Pontixanthobacter aestiaquae]MXO84046.1 thioredoxin domain-containing protein [Pontixanthobacter aestiaquae]